MSDSSGSTRRVYILATILGVLVLGYIFGAFSARFQTFPYAQLLEPPFRALEAYNERRELTEGSVLRTGLWHRTRTSDRGVTRRDSSRSWGDVTLYTSGHRAGAFLIDSTGEVLHRWRAPFREVWENPPHIGDPVPASRIYWRRVHLYPNGDILASYSGEGSTPYGYGLAKFDRNSELIWKVSAHVHHDFAVRDDGSIVALSHDWRDYTDDPVDGVPQLRGRVLEDRLLVISKDGKIRERISIPGAMADSPYRFLLDMYPRFIGGKLEAGWDPLHANTVNIAGPEFADHHAFAETGHVMTSFRNADAIGLVDLEDEQFTWASRGFWRQQHDPDPLPNGHILVFDNNGTVGPTGASRLLEFDPATNAIPWSYEGRRGEPFWSIGRASQETLPNGNVLVTESAGGRIFEITRDGDIVWEFHNPKRRTAAGRRFVPIVCSARRFPRSSLAFLE